VKVHPSMILVSLIHYIFCKANVIRPRLHLLRKERLETKKLSVRLIDEMQQNGVTRDVDISSNIAGYYETAPSFELCVSTFELCPTSISNCRRTIRAWSQSNIDRQTPYYHGRWPSAERSYSFTCQLLARSA